MRVPQFAVHPVILAVLLMLTGVVAQVMPAAAAVRTGSTGVALQHGRGHGGAASLVMRLDGSQAQVAMTDRSIPLEPVHGRIVQAIAG